MLIDQEWQARHDISLGFLLFRSLDCLFNLVRFLAESSLVAIGCKKDFFVAAFASIGFTLTDQQLQAYFYEEVNFHLNSLAGLKPRPSGRKERRTPA